MADEHEDDVLELDNQIEHDEAAETDDIVLEFEGDEQQEETPLIKQLRQRERDLARENLELKRSQNAGSKPPSDPGPMPDIVDYDFITEKHQAAVDAWIAKRDAFQNWDRDQKQAEQARSHTFERAMTNYRARAAKLGVKGFDAAEAAVKEVLPPEVQGVMVEYLEDAPKLVAALGQNPARLAAIGAEPNPMKQIIMLVKAEGAIKMTNRRKPPEPEADTILRGSAPVGGGMTQAKFTKRLNELEDEASRNGGKRTKIREFKAQYKGKFA